MTVEQIAIRQEIRQMLTEAGINRNTLKDMVREVLLEEVDKACMQIFHEHDMDSIIFRSINGNFNNVVKNATKDAIRDRVNAIFNRMTVTVDFVDRDGNSITE